MSIARKGTANYRVHPGEVLREEFLKPLNLFPRPASTISFWNDVALAPDTAVRLARFFGTSEHFWLNLQANYEINRAKQEQAAEIEKIEPRTVSRT